MKESALTTLGRVLRRRMGVAIVCALIVPATALGYSLLQEKEYSASASLLFRDPGFAQKLFGTSFFTPSSDPDREAATNLRLVSLGVVSARTAKKLGGGLTGKDVSEQVKAESEGQSNVVGITATADSPRQAARLANTFAEEYISFRRDADRSKIEQTLEIISGQLAALSPEELAGTRGKELERQKGQLELLRSLQTGNAELVQPADLPTSPSSPRTLRNLIVGMLVGIMLGLGMAFLVDRFDKRLRDVEEIQDIMESPILAQVPRDKALATRDWTGDVSPAVTETFHMLRANLRHVHSRDRLDSVVIASAAPGDGKTTIAWNLAVAEAGAGSRVLLIDGDMRQPDLAAHLNVPRSPGLSELLAGLVDFDAVVRRIPVTRASAPSQHDHSVDLIMAGRRPPNPSDLVESDEMEDLLRLAIDSYDLVVIDTPPMGIVSDAVPILRHVSGVIVAARLGKSTRTGLEALQEQLDYLRAPTLGVAVMNAKGQSRKIYGYGYAREQAAALNKRDEKEEAEKQETAKRETAKQPAANGAPAQQAAAAKASSKDSSDQTVPRWIYNRLTVTGDRKRLSEFVKRAQGEKDADTGEIAPLDFKRHVPTEPELIAAPTGGSAASSAAPENSDGWWHWNAMWPERDGEPRKGEVVYLFASAWSPPREWLAKASEEHPELTFALEFVEEFCHEAAGARWQRGEVVETWDVDPDDADWVEYDDAHQS